MKSAKAWAVLYRGKIEVWPDGQLGIWKKKPTKNDVASMNKVVRVEIREARKS